MARGKSTQPGHYNSKDGTTGPDDKDGRREWARYLGLSTQVAASVGLSLFLGVKADKWLKLTFPILSWALPLLVIVLLLVQLIKASSGGKNEK
jgi:hypothetical protein